MANEPEKVESGIFIDTKTGDIVHEKPEEGIQIVPEGGYLDDAAKARLAAEQGGPVGDVGVGPVVSSPNSGDDDVDKMTVDELKAHAEERGIDLGDASKKADILDAIKSVK